MKVIVRDKVNPHLRLAAKSRRRFRPSPQGAGK
jgi:hypothetical protein